MPHENLPNNNSARVFGRVASELTYSHDVYGEGFMSFRLEISRLSETADTLPVMISERLLEGERPEVGDLLHITGQIRSYNSYLQEEQRNKLILTVFARDIVRLEDEAEFYGNPNEIYLNGFICKPPVYRTTPFGREITDILLAVNRSYNKSDYIPCIAWGRNARYAGRLAVGDNIEVYGRMQSRMYQKRREDGETVDKTAYEVSVSKIETD